MSSPTEGAPGAPQPDDVLAALYRSQALIAAKSLELANLQADHLRLLGAYATAQGVDISVITVDLPTIAGELAPAQETAPAEAPAIPQENYDKAQAFAGQIETDLFPMAKWIRGEAAKQRPQQVTPPPEGRRRAKEELSQPQLPPVEWSRQAGPVQRKHQLTYTQEKPDTPPTLKRYRVEHMTAGPGNPSGLTVEFYFTAEELCKRMTVTWEAKRNRGIMSDPQAADAIQASLPADLQGDFGKLRLLAQPASATTEVDGVERNLDARGSAVIIDLPVADPAYSDIAFAVKASNDIPERHRACYPTDSSKVPVLNQKFAYNVQQNQLVCSEHPEAEAPAPISQEEYLRWLRFGLALSNL